MKKLFVYGAAVLVLAGPSLAAQQPGGTGSQARPPAGGRSDTGSDPQAGANQPRPADPATDTAGSRPASPNAAQPANAQTNPDGRFVMEAAQGGLAEVELGRLAADKAQSDAVKQFARRMITDHGKANDELKSVAQSKRITLPTELDATHKATKDRLSQMSGANFDRAYMQEMVNDHQKTVTLFREESQTGKDPELKAWAAKTLPVIQEHFQMAQSASGGAVGTSGTAAPPSAGDAAPAPGGSSPR
jgi:putative membrane protein